MVKYQGLSTLEILEGAYNYNKWIASEIEKYILPPTLEIGAGTGNISKYLLHTKYLYLTEKDRALVSFLKKKFTKHIKNIEKLDILEEIPKHLEKHFSVVFSVNVLEHIDDDLKALKHMHKLLKKSGKVVLLVPAKKFAFTRLDKTLGHFRRYEKKELKRKLLEANFEIEEIYFFNFVGLLSWIVRDMIEKNQAHIRSSHVALFDWIVPLLQKIESIRRVPIGISLVAVGRKL